MSQPLPKLYKPIPPDEVDASKSLADAPRNLDKSVQMFQKLRELLGQGFVRGFHGRVTLGLTIRGGLGEDIQYKIERTVK